jgi:hypothetical protein
MRTALLFLALMELVKIEALASFFFVALDKPLPLLPSSLVFLLGFGLGRWRREAWGGRGWLLSGGGLALGFGALYLASGRPGDRAALGLLLLTAGCFWARGLWLGRRPASHAAAVSRFDEGLGVFLFIFAMAALVHAANNLAGTLVLPFLLFALPALSLSNGTEGRPGENRARRRGAALLPPLCLLLLAGGGLLGLVPVLMGGAGRVQAWLRLSSGTSLTRLGLLLDRLFIYRRPAPPETVAGLAPPLDPETASSQGGPLIEALVGFLGLLALLFSLALLLFLLSRLLAFLARRIAPESPQGRFALLPAWLRGWILAAARFLGGLEAAARRLVGRRGALAAYARLLACGRLAGLARRPSETPREYGDRLARAVPGRAERIEPVVGALEKEVYGNEALDSATLEALAALRRRTWPWTFLRAPRRGKNS